MSSTLILYTNNPHIISTRPQTSRPPPNPPTEAPIAGAKLHTFNRCAFPIKKPSKQIVTHPTCARDIKHTTIPYSKFVYIETWNSITTHRVYKERRRTTKPKHQKSKTSSYSADSDSVVVQCSVRAQTSTSMERVA